jgi:hypothetical protein
MKELANNKIEAKITTLKLKIIELEREYESELYGGVTKEEFKLVVDSTKKELKIWEEIKNLIQ